MPYAEPQIEWAGKRYVILKRSDGPVIVESEMVEEALRLGAEYYPLSDDPGYEGWVEMDESHFRKLEENKCLEQILAAISQGEGSEPSQQMQISCSL